MIIGAILIASSIGLISYAMFETHKTYNSTTQLLISYVDKLDSYYGAESVAASIGVQGYANETAYNVIILSFLCNYGSTDAASVWDKPFWYIDPSSSPFGNTVAEV